MQCEISKTAACEQDFEVLSKPVSPADLLSKPAQHSRTNRSAQLHDRPRSNQISFCPAIGEPH